MFIDPTRTSSFGVSGHLMMAGTFGIGEADYWYHTPFFWLVKDSGEVIFRNGNGRHDIGQDDPVSVLRMLSKPVFFVDKLGFRIESDGDNATTHLPTGRPATEVPIRGSAAGLTATGTMIIDNETAVVLSVAVLDGLSPDPLISVETTRFAVHDTMDAAIFGEETLETGPSYYYARLSGTDTA
jgi:hypothetical protein